MPSDTMQCIATKIRGAARLGPDKGSTSTCIKISANGNGGLELHSRSMFEKFSDDCRHFVCSGATQRKVVDCFLSAVAPIVDVSTSDVPGTDCVDPSALDLRGCVGPELCFGFSSAPEPAPPPALLPAEFSEDGKAEGFSSFILGGIAGSSLVLCLVGVVVCVVKGFFCKKREPVSVISAVVVNDLGDSSQP